MQVNKNNNCQNFSFQEINGKSVYIFEDHATAVIPWMMIKKRLNVLPHLITLDHHTDTMDAFRFYYGCLSQQGNSIEDIEVRINNMIAELEKLEKESKYNEMKSLLKHLRFDEQIDLSIKLGVLSYSITLPSSAEGEDYTKSDRVKKYHQDLKEYEQAAEKIYRSGNLNLLSLISRPIYPEEDGVDLIKTYSMPENKIFIVNSNVIYNSSIGEGSLYSHNYNSNVIEDGFLHNQIGLASSMTITAVGKVVTDGPYILDIDLDYFHNSKSIQPENHECFYALIRNAEAITIARESECVQMCKEDLEDSCSFNSDFLQNKLLQHIHAATSYNNYYF